MAPAEPASALLKCCEGAPQGRPLGGSRPRRGLGRAVAAGAVQEENALLKAMLREQQSLQPAAGGPSAAPPT